MDHQSRDIEIIKRIDAYLKGQLSEQEVDELWVDLLKEPKYLEYLETELALKSIFEEKEKIAAQESSGAIYSLKKPWPWLAAAASAIIIIVAVNILRLDTSANLQPEAIAQINIMDNLAAPMVTRSLSSELSGADSLLSVGFEAALSGDLDRAVQLYEQVARLYADSPPAAQAYLNIGIIRYNDQNYQGAVRSFEQTLETVSDDIIIREKAYWYLGNSYLNLGQTSEAHEAIKNTLDMHGIFEQPASRLLPKISYELGHIDQNELEQQLDAQ